MLPAYLVRKITFGFVPVILAGYACSMFARNLPRHLEQHRERMTSAKKSSPSCKSIATLVTVKSADGRSSPDSRKLAFSGGQSGKTIVAGKSGEYAVSTYCRTWRAGTDADGRKASRCHGNRDNPKWTDGGAIWPETAGQEKAEIRKHWAYIAPERPEVPSPKNASWAANAIDRFTLARLEKEGPCHPPKLTKQHCSVASVSI